jgi:2-polyprenyl-6-methoxyphenol hydroxylase-like FAD-dependent oxidoreductase
MPKVSVVGGSIGGLCAGIALRGIGCDVSIYERAKGPMTSRGAGIVVRPSLLRLLREAGAPELPMTSCLYRRFLLPDGGDGLQAESPLRFTSWAAIYRTLRTAFPDGDYQQGSTLTGFEQTASCVVAHFPERDEVVSDLLICAEGSRSESRRRLIPATHSRYTGYVAWRGTVEEKNIPTQLMRFFDDTFTICKSRSGGHILCYVIPGADAGTDVGRRRLNWVWYVSVPSGPQLERLLRDKAGLLHESSVSAGMVPAPLIAEVHAVAARELHPSFVDLVQMTPDPFIQTITDVVVPRMSFGRVCLLGDAAFVLRPHPAAATAKAAEDAIELAEALIAVPNNPPVALKAWGTRQAEYGRVLADYAIAVGRRSVEQGGAFNTLSDMAECFRGVSPPSLPEGGPLFTASVTP